MPKRIKFAFFLLLLISLSLSFPASSVLAYYTNMNASLVVGQQNFTSGSANQGGSAAANTLQSPVSAVVTGSKLIMSESANNRVLIFNSIPTTNNASADVVIGQPDFTSNSTNQGGSAAANTLNSPRGITVC